MGKYAVKKIGIIERYQEYLPVTDAEPDRIQPRAQ